MPTPRPSPPDAPFEDPLPSTLTKIAPPVSVTGPKRAVLQLLSGLNAGQLFRLEGETFVGRDRSCEVCVEDGSVSRRHARLAPRSSGGWVLEDLRSRNGVFKNGVRIEGLVELAPGDRLMVGSVDLRFTLVDETEEALQRRLYEASTRDPLTHAYNRRYFDSRLLAEVAFANRHGSVLTLVLLDIDHFKSVNDRFGHGGGDDVLRALAATVNAAIRTEDLFARTGGEEFALLLRGVDRAGARILAERLRVQVERLAVDVGGGGTAQITVSAGIAELEEVSAPPASDRTIETRGRTSDPGVAAALVALADERLYQAKRAGRNCVRDG
jgi:diguanylate cyclase (GGDEF)-like protein